MQLPPGPGAPPVWQTIAWMARPAAFMRRIHERYGDPVTIRTYWTEQPMVLFSDPDSVREIFRLDPAIAPAGQSWEFLRPFAGEHSILLLDGDEHLRERRLLQGPFHGERMRAFAPMVGELARSELSTWNGRVVALDRMRELTLEVILRVVFGAGDGGEAARLRDVIESALSTVRSLPQILAMALVMRDFGRHSPWGRFRVAVRRFDEVLLELVAQRRRQPRGDSVLDLLLEQRDEHGNAPSDRHLRDELVALLVGGHDSSAASLAWAFERLARHPEVQARLREGDPAYLDAVVTAVMAVAGDRLSVDLNRRCAGDRRARVDGVTCFTYDPAAPNFQILRPVLAGNPCCSKPVRDRHRRDTLKVRSNAIGGRSEAPIEADH